MKTTLLLLACLAAPISAQAAQVPIGLDCTAVTMIHSKEFKEFQKSGASAEDQKSMNRCISAVQTYARAHCPQSKRTIWQQIEAVAYSGPGIPDKKALLAACN